MCFLTTTFPNAPAHPPPILFDQSLMVMARNKNLDNVSQTDQSLVSSVSQAKLPCTSHFYLYLRTKFVEP